MSDEKTKEPQTDETGRLVEVSARIVSRLGVTVTATVDKSARWPSLSFEEKTATLQAGDEPLNLHKAIRERWPAMNDVERLAALEALEVPRDLWLELATGSPSELQERAWELFTQVKPAQVIRPPSISVNTQVGTPTITVEPKQYRLEAEAGHYTIQGGDAELLVHRRLKAEAGNFSIEGQAAELVVTGTVIKPALPKPKPIANSDGLIPMAGDRINQSAILALTPGAMQRRSDIAERLDGLSAQGLERAPEMSSAYTFRYKDGTAGAIGFFKDPGDALWAMIQKNGELEIRLQYALWAHAYAEHGEPEPGKFVTLNISSLCDSLGYKRQKGAHQKKNKQAVKEALRALTQLELIVIAKLKNGRAAKLKGELWTRGIEADTAESYDDLFGSNRVGDPGAWDPVTFAYAPGPFFANAEWREYNRAVALVGKNLLSLPGKHDKWAVMIGGYLAITSRMNHYRTQTFYVSTLLNKSGLSRELSRRVARMHSQFERALDRLAEENVIASWRYDKTGLSTDEVDSLDETALDRIHTESKSDWRQWSVVIEWPKELQAAAPAIAKRQKRAATRRVKHSSKARQKR